MILELIEYLMTPCPAEVRSMGFLASSMQVRARARRCRRAWAPHLANTKRAVLGAVERCPRRRVCVVLGAGLLHDIPVRELSEAFGKVVLVDVVHLWLSRLAVRRFRNVEQLAADATEVMEKVWTMHMAPGGAFPESHPMRFMDAEDLDLTISVNLLSQLPYVPSKVLRGRCDDAALDAFLRQLVKAHLDYLARLPGHTALITDVAMRSLATESGEELERTDLLRGVALPPPDAAWEWRIAPSPEVERGVDVVSDVACYFDWKSAFRL
jgi:hypothetical protein